MELCPTTEPERHAACSSLRELIDKFTTLTLDLSLVDQTAQRSVGQTRRAKGLPRILFALTPVSDSTHRLTFPGEKKCPDTVEI